MALQPATTGHSGLLVEYLASKTMSQGREPNQTLVLIDKILLTTGSYYENLMLCFNLHYVSI